MNSRLVSIYDATTGRRTTTEVPKTDEAPSDSLYNNIKSRLRSRLPAGYTVGDLLKVRILPALQGVVLGKVWGRDALRVIIAPYVSAGTPFPAAAIDLPAQLIPDQAVGPTFLFENPTAVASCVRFFADKAAIKKEQEVAILQWINKKESPDYSTYSAVSEALNAEQLEVVELQEESNQSDEEEAPSNSSSSSSQASRLCNRELSQIEGVSLCPDPDRMEEFKKELSSQMSELREMMTTVLKRQKDCEEQIKHVASQVTASATSQWEQLEEKVQAMTALEGGLETARRGGTKRAHGLDEDPDWPDRESPTNDIEWQVKTVPSKRTGDPQEEKIECPFRPQPRRLDGFRVPRAHRRAHRRFLEDVYGSHDSATAAARAILEQMEKEIRAPSWEVAGFLNAARGLDILLLEHQDGMWSQWNQPLVDFLARSYFEMLARIRPDEDVVQLMNPELQRKIREFNFGKQRAYGPFTPPPRPGNQRPWKSFQAYGTGSTYQGTRKDAGSTSKRSQGTQEEQLEGGGNEYMATQGNWVWQPPPPTGGRPPPPPFRNDNAPAFPGIAGPRPPQ